VDRYVANSQATKRVMLESAPWLDESRVALIYNGIDADRFAAATPAGLDLPEGSFTVGYVGRLDPEKGADLVPDAWARIADALPDAHLVIAGAGKSEREMRARLGDSPRVRWPGFRRDVAELMNALDLLIVPSRSEAFGLAAAEAMACGVPVVAARVGGLPEVVIDGEQGVLVPPEDPAALAKAVIALARDPERRAAMGRAGRERVRAAFSLERTLDGYEALLEEMIARKRGGRAG
jgi:glycosyltransferase involved in cell wall biosynthesis